MTDIQFQMIMRGILCILYALVFPGDHPTINENFTKLEEAFLKYIQEAKNG